MIGDKKVVCVIPARLCSTRFPRKVLASLMGKPLVQWAWEGALKVPCFDEVVVAVDSEEVAEKVTSFGGRYFMTSESCENATERLIEIQKRGLLHGDIWVNWQSDEPFLSDISIADLLQSADHDHADVWTLKSPIEASAALDPNICKVVCDHEGFALYFSRSVIPYSRDDLENKSIFKHVGLYAYTKESLEKISTLSSCDIEEKEMLEQLRFLFYGLKIQVHETKEDSVGIDLPEHLFAAEDQLKRGTIFPF